MMKELLFTGSGVAIVTPFTETGIDFDKLGELIEDQIKHKTDALIICGTTGEASTMPDGEHKAAIKYAVEKVNKRIPVIAGTGSNDTVHCLDLSQYAENIGADGLLIVTPYYNKTTQKGLVEHFSYIAENVKIPIILYNVPSRTGMSISMDTYAKLAEIPNIVGVKEASGDLGYVAQIASKFGEKLHIYSGNDDIIVPILSVGGKGVISVLANVMPEETHNICEYYLNGEIEKSRKLQLELLEIINALFVEVNPIPIKTAMNLLGRNVGKLRRPLCDMSDKNLEILKTALKNRSLI